MKTNLARLSLPLALLSTAGTAGAAPFDLTESQTNCERSNLIAPELVCRAEATADGHILVSIETESAAGGAGPSVSGPGPDGTASGSVGHSTILGERYSSLSFSSDVSVSSQTLGWTLTDALGGPVGSGYSVGYLLFQVDVPCERPSGRCVAGIGTREVSIGNGGETIRLTASLTDGQTQEPFQTGEMHVSVQLLLASRLGASGQPEVGRQKVSLAADVEFIDVAFVP